MRFTFLQVVSNVRDMELVCIESSGKSGRRPRNQYNSELPLQGGYQFSESHVSSRPIKNIVWHLRF